MNANEYEIRRGCKQKGRFVKTLENGKRWCSLDRLIKLRCCCCCYCTHDAKRKHACVFRSYNISYAFIATSVRSAYHCFFWYVFCFLLFIVVRLLLVCTFIDTVVVFTVLLYVFFFRWNSARFCTFRLFGSQHIIIHRRRYSNSHCYLLLLLFLCAPVFFLLLLLLLSNGCVSRKLIGNIFHQIFNSNILICTV